MAERDRPRWVVSYALLVQTECQDHAGHPAVSKRRPPRCLVVPPTPGSMRPPPGTGTSRDSAVDQHVPSGSSILSGRLSQSWIPLSRRGCLLSAHKACGEVLGGGWATWRRAGPAAVSQRGGVNRKPSIASGGRVRGQGSWLVPRSWTCPLPVSSSTHPPGICYKDTHYSHGPKSCWIRATLVTSFYLDNTCEGSILTPSHL